MLSQERGKNENNTNSCWLAILIIHQAALPIKNLQHLVDFQREMEDYSSFYTPEGRIISHCLGATKILDT
jgi:hypothetical protein